ncbi:MAG: hypothetical protein NT086_08990 [Proteobacteria bacterium]|nr:hypothetical protein [Pseudomonadota bacterium]
MALVKCKDCRKENSTTAVQCIYCGGVINKTSRATWLATVFMGLLLIMIILSKCSSSETVVSEAVVAQACKPINEGALWLPKDKEFAQIQFTEKANRLNSSGLCVVEGGFGRSYEKYYITVSKTGDVRYAEILRFTYEELSR